jgi:acyl-CoA synthetase (AMP-forming)/AMP-acid ligase II
VRLANGLLALSLRPQDRVGVLQDNTLEFADFFLGAAIANLARVTLYPRNARESHLHMLAHTGCRAVVVAEKYAAEIEVVRDERRGRYGSGPECD